MRIWGYVDCNVILIAKPLPGNKSSWHEYNESLHTRGYEKIFRAGNKSDKARMAHVRRVLAALYMLTTCHNGIVDVTKIESKSLELKRERFNLNNIIINAIDDIILGKDLVNSSNVQLLYEPKDIVSEADKGRMTQVFSNLISNASKFTKIGTITIATKIEDNNQIIISVKDTGSGIV